MAVGCHLLILLIPVLSLCGATEYYVRSTEPTNTSCPAQPCLTLNRYARHSHRYFQSNTVFKFLPGTHHMDRPVTIGKVHNMSLESFNSERPHLVAHFSCRIMEHDCIPVSAWIYRFDVCCAAFWLHDVHNVTFKGIILTVQTPNVSGVIFRSVSKVSIQWATTYSSHDHYCFGIVTFKGIILTVQTPNVSGVILTNVYNVRIHLTTTYSSYDHYCLGITVFEADSVEVDSSSTNNCTYGFTLAGATNSNISDITAMYNMWGMALMNINNISHICNKKYFGGNVLR